MRKIITILTIIVILFSVFAILTVSNAADGETEEFTWTDFSNAKYEIKRTGYVDGYVEITGVTPIEGSMYYCIITTDSNKPEIDSSYIASDDRLLLIEYDEESKIFKTSNITKYIELNQELYISIIDQNSNAHSKNVVTYGNKLTRYSEPKYSDAFFATHMTNDSDQIVTNFTHDRSNDRKIQIKVGKITDTTILQKLKNSDSSGFSDLLSFAKSNSAIYDQNLDADKDKYNIQFYRGRAT